VALPFLIVFSGIPGVHFPTDVFLGGFGAAFAAVHALLSRADKSSRPDARPG
jgi:hypothetical protein